MRPEIQIINRIFNTLKRKGLEITWEHTDSNPDLFFYAVPEIELACNGESIDSIKNYVINYVDDMYHYYNKLKFYETGNTPDTCAVIIKELADLYKKSATDFIKFLKLDDAYNLKIIDCEEYFDGKTN